MKKIISIIILSLIAIITPSNVYAQVCTGNKYEMAAQAEINVLINENNLEFQNDSIKALFIEKATEAYVKACQDYEGGKLVIYPNPFQGLRKTVCKSKNSISIVIICRCAFVIKYNKVYGDQEKPY